MVRKRTVWLIVICEYCAVCADFYPIVFLPGASYILHIARVGALSVIG